MWNDDGFGFIDADIEYAMQNDLDFVLDWTEDYIDDLWSVYQGSIVRNEYTEGDVLGDIDYGPISTLEWNDLRNRVILAVDAYFGEEYADDFKRRVPIQIEWAA